MSSQKENYGYFAVCLPIHVQIDDNDKNDNFVFIDKSAALSAVKKYKGSRFKSFVSYNDAILFTKENVNLNDGKNNTQSIEQILCPFRSPQTTDLSKLRKEIEVANYDTVKGIIWSNPRYLISDGDTPVVLMGGPRYNACHIAAKSGRSVVLKLLLETISDIKFMKKLYPHDDDCIAVDRVNFILDLYLNTPDKGACETPLHFACKFGYVETVKVLLSFSECDTNKANKLNQKASEIICDRKGDSSAKIQIQNLFEERIYIPVIHNDDCSVTIGQPCDAIPDDTRIKAIAGPMSPEHADEIYRVLKSPSRSISKEDRNIRRSDPTKGFERIARKACKERGVQWTEFWTFLNCKINLASDEGLNKLEEHLSNVYENLKFSRNGNVNKNVNIDASIRNEEIEEISNDLLNFGFNDLENEEEYHSLNESDASEDSGGFITAPSSPTFPIDFYVNGSEYSQMDKDAALAIEKQKFDSYKYPYINEWYKNVIKRIGIINLPKNDKNDDPFNNSNAIKRLNF